jgi:hypothetical protein
MNALTRFLPGPGRPAARSGRFPLDVRARLETEDLAFLEEGLRGSITYRRYRDPHMRASFAKESIRGAIAVTASRLMVWTDHVKYIDVPFSHPLRAAVEVTLDGPGRVCFAFDAAKFSTARSGRVEVRLRTAQAGQVVTMLAASGG